MTIKDAVKQVIAALPGNQWVSGTRIVANVLKIDRDEPINVAQVKRAIRDLPHVQRDSRGNYRVKGRRVPPK